jgi:hypothetical protein
LISFRGFVDVHDPPFLYIWNPFSFELLSVHVNFAPFVILLPTRFAGLKGTTAAGVFPEQPTALHALM